MKVREGFPFKSVGLTSDDTETASANAGEVHICAVIALVQYRLALCDDTLSVGWSWALLVQFEVRAECNSVTVA